MKRLITFFFAGVVISGCATAKFSRYPVKHQIPDTGITVSDNKIFHDGKILAELRYFFTSRKSQNPGEAYLFSSETQHRGLGIYYEREKELVWIFPEEGREEDVKRGRFTARGDSDGKVGWAYDVRISDDGKFIYWKKPGLITQSSYVFSVEHGTSELIDRDWHLWWRITKRNSGRIKPAAVLPHGRWIRQTMNFRIFKQIKYACALFAILLPVMAICGAIISPPSWAETALRKYDYNTKIFVGFSSRTTGSGDGEYQRSSRSYILLPSFKAVTITKESHKNRNEESIFKETSYVTTKESIFLTYYWSLSYFAFLFGTWWYWIRPSTKRTDKWNT